MTAPVRPRVVVLGASNVSLGLPEVVTAARHRLGAGPLEVLVAAGHGRSFGRPSRVLGRELPGILGCGLWRRLEEGVAKAPTRALVTDVGNDIGFGVAPPRVAAWVEECVDRLRAAGARVTVTGLPVATLEQLPRWWFEVVRRVLYPGRPLRFDGVREGIREVQGRLARLAMGEGVELVLPDPRWYGPDAIHIRRRHRRQAWSTSMAGWGGGPAPAPTRSDRWRLHRARPARQWILGLERRRAQPSARLDGGTTVSLF